MASRLAIFSLASAVSMVTAMSAAEATVVNYTGYDVAMGNVIAGQTGTISNFFKSSPGLARTDYQDELSAGFLAPYSQISFNIALTGNILDSAGYVSGNNVIQNISSLSMSDTTGNSFSEYYNTTTQQTTLSTSRVSTTATINDAGNDITLTIANVTSGAALYSQQVLALFQKADLLQGGTVTYSVSSVPLPGSFSLFLAALAGFVGFQMKRQHKNLVG